MAEKIDKPKKFTKMWFHYIWDYYKVHMLVGAAVAVLLAVTLVELLTAVRYDVNINYVATNVLSYDTSERMANDLAEQIHDSNGDGERHISVVQLNFTDESMQNASQYVALENKLLSILASEDEMFFIMDEVMLQDVLEMDATEGIFVPVSDWCESLPANELLYEYEGEAYAVSLKNSAFFREMGIDASNMYVMVKMNYNPEDEDLQNCYDNCIFLANVLVSE